MAMNSSSIVLFGTGSPIIVDVEESLAFAGIELAAAVQNREGKSALLAQEKLVTLSGVTEAWLRLPFLVPLFTPSNRQLAASEASALGFGPAFSLVDSTVRVPRSLQSGEGLYINAGCALGAASELAEFVFLNRGVCLGHHARLERFVSIGPGAVVGSLVTIGMGTLIGAGAVVLPERKIGSNAVVGAGAVVLEDVPDHCLVVGNPARIVKRDIPGYAGGTVH